jgi:hypothetical protein
MRAILPAALAMVLPAIAAADEAAWRAMKDELRSRGATETQGSDQRALVLIESEGRAVWLRVWRSGRREMCQLEETVLWCDDFATGERSIAILSNLTGHPEWKEIQ